MPLKNGPSQEIINKNIAELVRPGFKPKQAVAIAFRKAGKPKLKEK